MIFVNSLPKSGTNLLERLVSLLGFSHSGVSVALSSVRGRHETLKRLLRVDHFRGENIPVGLELPASISQRWLQSRFDAVGVSQYVSGHAAYSEQLHNLLLDSDSKTIQIYRDPKAVMVSWAEYVVEPENRYYPFYEHHLQMTLDERVRFLCDGGSVGRFYHSSFGEILNRALGWVGKKNVLAIRYESLVGEMGGGSKEAQNKCVSDVAEFLGICLKPKEIADLSMQLYGRSKTFRTGTVDGWRSKISPSTESKIEHLLDQFGIENIFDSIS